MLWLIGSFTFLREWTAVKSDAKMKWIIIALASLFVSCNGVGLKNGSNYCRYNSVIQLIYYTPALKKAVLDKPGDVKIELERGVEIDVKTAITKLSTNTLDTACYTSFKNNMQDPAVWTLQEIAFEVPAFSDICGVGYMDYRKTTLKNGTVLEDFKIPQSELDIPLNIITVGAEYKTENYLNLQDYLDRGSVFRGAHSVSEDPIWASRPYTRRRLVRRTNEVMLISLTMSGEDDAKKFILGDHLDYEETVKIRALTNNDKDLVLKTYNLVAVLKREGNTAQSGHFYTYAKTSTGQWKIFNDSSVTNTTLIDALSLKSTFLLLSFVEDPSQRQAIVPNLTSLDSQGLEYLRKTLPIKLQLHFTYDGRLHRYMHYDNSSNGLLGFFETTDLVKAKGRMASAEFIPAVTALDTFGKNLADNVCVVFEQLVGDAIPANKTCGAFTAIVDSTKK